MSTASVSKSELVGEAIDALGLDASYEDVRGHVLAKHEVTVSRSAYYDERKRRRSDQTSPAKQTSKPAESPAPKAADPLPISPPAKQSEPVQGTVSIKDLPELMKAARELSERLGGKETLKQFLDAL